MIRKTMKKQTIMNINKKSWGKLKKQVNKQRMKKRQIKIMNFSKNKL